MKVLQLVSLLRDYQPVTITPDCDLDWDENNPYVLEPEKVRDLKWVFVQKVADREVTEIGTNANETDVGPVAYLTISYK